MGTGHSVRVVLFLSFVVGQLVLLTGCGGGGSNGGGGNPTPISVSIVQGASVSIDYGQTQALTATVLNDAKNGGVTWSVSGPGSLANQTATSVTYNAPATGAVATATVTATSASDTSKSASLTVHLTPAPTIAATPVPPTGANGSVYSFVVPESGGMTPLTWSISSGALPGGLTLDQTGKISGTPNANATLSPYSFTVKVQDAANTSATQAYSLAINNPPAPVISSAVPPTGTNGDAYAGFTFAVSGGLAPFTWSETGALPTGITFAADVLSGTPHQAGSFLITVTVQDSSNPVQSAQQNFMITVINPGPPTITTTSVKDGIQGTPYSQTIVAANGLAPFTWSVTGALPAGLSFGTSTTNSVALSGTPTTVQAGVGFTVHIMDALNRPASQSYTMNVNPPPVVTITNPITHIEAGGTAVILNATVTNDTASQGVNWTLTANGGACSPTCGFLSNVTPTSVMYTSPSAVPTSPNNNPTITATSVLDNTRSTPNNFTIIAPNASACTLRGNESAMAGQYAFSLSGHKGSDFITVVGAFTADGTGGIMAGEADVNGTIDGNGNALTTGGENGSIDTVHSSYSVGADNRGCVKIVTSFGTFITRTAFGGISSGVATKGRMIEWETGATAYVATGQVVKQTVADFSSGLNGDYTTAAVSMDANGARYGSATTSTAAFNSSNVPPGAFTSVANDFNANGLPVTTKTCSGPCGTYTNFDSNGRSTATVTFGPGDSSTFAMYMVSAPQLLHISTDITRSSGEIRKHSTLSFNGTAVLSGTGKSTTFGGPHVAIGTIASDGNGSATFTVQDDDAGSLTPVSFTCAYGAPASSGKMTPPPPDGNCPIGTPILYLTDTNAGFLLGTDGQVMVGEFAPQAGGPFGQSSLSGTFFTGTGALVNQNNAGVAQTTLDGNGNVSRIGDYTGTTTQTPGGFSFDTATINTDGSFSFVGGMTGLLISGSNFVAIDSPNQSTPSILIGKK